MSVELTSRDMSAEEAEVPCFGRPAPSWLLLATFSASVNALATSSFV
jgi:hypothetical protein